VDPRSARLRAIINKILVAGNSLAANDLILFVFKISKHGTEEAENIIVRGRSEPGNGPEELPGIE
jgi:hypothetical protein